MTNYAQWAGQNTSRHWPSARAERIARIVWIVAGALALPVLFIAVTGGIQ